MAGDRWLVAGGWWLVAAACRFYSLGGSVWSLLGVFRGTLGRFGRALDVFWDTLANIGVHLAVWEGLWEILGLILEAFGIASERFGIQRSSKVVQEGTSLTYQKVEKTVLFCWVFRVGGSLAAHFACLGCSLGGLDG